MKSLSAAFALVLALLAVSCGSDNTCVESSDCFSGEVCTGGTCEAAQPNGSPSNSNNGTSPNGTTDNNATTGNNATSNNATTNNATTNNGNPNGTPNNNGGSTCLVDPFTATCNDDDYEENDEVDREVLPHEPDSWCAGGVLRTDASFDATFCNSDGLDTYRFLIDNRGPVCITEPFTIRMEVVIDETCNPDLVDVVPYTFFDDPNRVDLCAEDENVRCTSFESGQRRVIEWRQEPEQMPDVRLLVGSDENNVQFNYTVNITIIP